MNKLSKSESAPEGMQFYFRKALKNAFLAGMAAPITSSLTDEELAREYVGSVAPDTSKRKPK